MDTLSRLLEALAGMASGPRGARADDLHRAALEYEDVQRLPLVLSYPYPEDTGFQPLPGAAMYQSSAAMLYNELVSAWGTSVVMSGTVGDDLAPTVRPNWGTVLVASVLGGCAEQAEDNTPWIRRNEGHPISLEYLAEADPKIETSGWIPRVLDTYQAYQEFLAPYPELKSKVHLTLPDLQGPLDTVEQLLGADLFVDMIERPELCARAFRRVAEVQVACARLFQPYIQDGPKGYTHQHGFLVKGQVLVRCDSAVMISPAMYSELVAPADEMVMKALGGGGIHSCGRIDHAAPAMLGLPSLRCFDFGQSYMNEVDALYSLASKRRIPFLRIQPSRRELETGSIMDRFPSGVSLYYCAESMTEAQQIFDCYSTTCMKRR